MRLNIDLVAFEHICAAPSDPDEAANALLLAADYLRRREALPDNLADYLADALESAALKPAAHRADALARELHLTSGNRRPAANWLEVGEAVDAVIHSGLSLNAAKAQIAGDFGIGESTVLRYWQRWCAASEANARIE